MTDAIKDPVPVPSVPVVTVVPEKIEWWKSKTVWSAIVGAILGAVQPVSQALGHPVTVPNYVFEVLAGFGLYSLRTSTQDIK